jgi:hypothetical protein
VLAPDDPIVGVLLVTESQLFNLLLSGLIHLNSFSLLLPSRDLIAFLKVLIILLAPEFLKFLFLLSV